MGIYNKHVHGLRNINNRYFTIIFSLCVMAVVLFFDLPPVPIKIIWSSENETKSDTPNFYEIKLTANYNFIKDEKHEDTPNFYEIVLAKSTDCLKKLNSCKGKKCLCGMLCNTPVKEKFVSGVFEYDEVPIEYEKNNEGKENDRIKNRLIPKIIHQTWYEEISKDQYPNLSRLSGSWEIKDWDYRFYNDTDADLFISKHFPKEVREAYDTLMPGAYKADLFRYCVLFIHGGVYADVDVLLESDLEVVIDDDVGFVVPIDITDDVEEGTICLWNGLMVSTPGHPFLAGIIETVVNQVRNRFTIVDSMNNMCHENQLTNTYSIQNHRDLYLTGPCVLGATINKILKRAPQENFESDNRITQHLVKESNASIPGRINFLEMKIDDMGAARFTLLEKNKLVAATLLPGTSTKDNGKHYSNTAKDDIVHGTVSVYKDMKIAHENIQIKARRVTNMDTKEKEYIEMNE